MLVVKRLVGLPVTRFGTQISNGDAIAIQTLYYSHNTNRAFPDPMVPDPGSRIRINETPYSAGTTISFNPVFAGSLDLIADIRGPSAQRVADDLDRTFTSAFTSRIGALWFADHGDAFSEVNTRVGIDFTDTQARHFLEAYTERNWTPQHLVPGATVDRLGHIALSANTMISWRRDGDNFVVTVTGNDREHVGFALRNFLADRAANRSTLYFRSDGSTGSPASDAAAAALPYIALDLPDLEGYNGGPLARMTAIENQQPRFPAPDSQYDQAGATALSLFGLQQFDTEVIRFADGKTITADYPAGATNIIIGNGGSQLVNNQNAFTVLGAPAIGTFINTLDHDPILSPNSYIMLGDGSRAHWYRRNDFATRRFGYFVDDSGRLRGGRSFSTDNRGLRVQADPAIPATDDEITLDSIRAWHAGRSAARVGGNVVPFPTVINLAFERNGVTESVDTNQYSVSNGGVGFRIDADGTLVLVVAATDGSVDPNPALLAASTPNFDPPTVSAIPVDDRVELFLSGDLLSDAYRDADGSVPASRDVATARNGLFLFDGTNWRQR